MYNIEKKKSGYILTFSGEIDATEMKEWVERSKITLFGENRHEFGVIVDMKDLKPLKADARELMIEGQKLYKDKGMKRSAVILSSTELTHQFKNLAMQSGIYLTERYIDASKVKKPIEAAVNWVLDEKDPDK